MTARFESRVGWWGTWKRAEAAETPAEARRNSRVGWLVIAGISLRYNIPLHYYLLAVPLLSVTLLAPSVGGLGVREAVAPLLFASAGISQSQAVALSLLEFTAMRLAGLAGAPVYLWSLLRRRPPKKSKSQPG